MLAAEAPEQLASIISKLLTDLVARNDQVSRAQFSRHTERDADFPIDSVAPVFASRPQLPLVPTQVTPFHSSRPPAITVKSYLEDRCAHSPLQAGLTARRDAGCSL